MLRPAPLARPRAVGDVVVAVLVAAALLGGVSSSLTGCLTQLGPDIRREAPHRRMTQSASRGDCLLCHETESHMSRRMQAMSPAEMTAHMQYITTVVHPPLVQDWMVKEKRDCVTCHRVREPRG